MVFRLLCLASVEDLVTINFEVKRLKGSQLTYHMSDELVGRRSKLVLPSSFEGEKGL